MSEVRVAVQRDRSAFATIEEAIEDIRAGKVVIVVDDADRENEGDFIMAAERVTPRPSTSWPRTAVASMCLPDPGERLDELRIPLMAAQQDGDHETAFAVSVDAASSRHGTSAHDRAATVKRCDPATTSEDILMPGHIFPLRAQEGGVLRRAGHTEAAVDLAKLAGLFPAGVICEIMHPDGTMARCPSSSAWPRSTI